MTEQAKSDSMPMLWFSAQGGRLIDDFPDFFEVDDLDWAGPVEAQWTVIRDEVLRFVADHDERVHPYFNRRLVSRPRSWMTASFLFWGIPLRHNRRLCPRTMGIVSSIPGLVSASISMLEPGSEIYPHRGDTNAIYRCHLPLDVPATLPACGFRVNSSTTSWNEGELLVFCDAARHSAWNRTEKRRVLLLFDVIRPEFADQRRQVCSGVLSSLAAQVLNQHIPLLGRVSSSTKARLRNGIDRVIGVGLRVVGA